MTDYICTTYANDNIVRATRHKTAEEATGHAERVLARTLELSEAIAAPTRRTIFRADVRAGESGAALFTRELVA